MPWEYKKMEGAGGGASGRVEQGQVHLPSLLLHPHPLWVAKPPTRSPAGFHLHQHFCPVVCCLLVCLTQRVSAAFENPFLKHA